jgi:hypothetical protein
VEVDGGCGGFEDSSGLLEEADEELVAGFGGVRWEACDDDASRMWRRGSDVACVDNFRSLCP